MNKLQVPMHKIQFPECDTPESYSPRGPEGLNAGDIVEIVSGKRKGEQGIIRFRTGGGRADIQFLDGAYVHFEASEYRAIPLRRFNTELRDAVAKALES